MHQNRDERCRPIVHVQDLDSRSESPCEFNGRFAKENESRGIVFVRFAVFAVNSVPIEERVTSDEENLNAAVGVPFNKFSYVGVLANSHVDGNGGVLLSKRSILPNLSIMRDNQTDLVTA